mgnify:CR=1 FL=1
MIAAAVTLIRLVPPRLAFNALAILVAMVSLLYFVKARERAATANATANIERANHAASERFSEASEAVSRCYGTGGDWDRFERLCRHAAR